MIRLATNILGVFALKNGRIIERILFPMDVEKIADRLEVIKDGVSEEEVAIIEKLKRSGVREVYVIDPERFPSTLGIKFLKDSEIIDPSYLAEEIGIGREEFSELISKVNLELAKRRLKGIGRDQILIQAINSIDELDESINKLVKRLREWYSLNFPELDYVIKNNETYAKAVSSVDKLDKGLRNRINSLRRESTGIEFSERDYEVVTALSDSILCLYSTRREIESYIDHLMSDIAPNLSTLAGPMLGARLIALAGGLERLSFLPASTIQVLGAESAFFRFLRTGKKPPKHGVIFQLPEIRSSPKRMRGKVARTFAAKVAIAARADHFNGKFVGDKLRRDFLRKIEKLK